MGRWLGLLLVLVASGALLAAAAAGAPSPTVLLVDDPYPLNLDPTQAYAPNMDVIFYATCLKLVNYPDVAGANRPVPEASLYPQVSDNRKEWSFTIKSGLKFSDGSPVDSQDVVWTIDRVLREGGPGGELVSNLVGATAVLDHKAQTASGVHAVGQNVILDYTKPEYNAPLKLATNYFCIVPSGTPDQLTEPAPMAGPYYIADYSHGSEMTLKTNPFYTGSRPQGTDQIDVDFKLLEQIAADVKGGQVDLALDGSLDDETAQALHRAGTLKVNSLLETDFVAFNASRPLFHSPKTRQAVNYAIDRPAMLRQRGAFGGQRTDQILPPGMAGFRDAHIYPLQGPDLKTARKLLGGHCRPQSSCHGVVYTCNFSDCLAQAHILVGDLAPLGIELSVKALSPVDLYEAGHVAHPPFDAVITGWASDYADPFSFVDTVMSPLAGNGLNVGQLPAKEQARMKAASKLLGPARYKAYGALDVDITAHAAPWAAFDNRNEREFISSHVRNYVFSPVYGGLDLAAVQLR